MRALSGYHGIIETPWQLHPGWFYSNQYSAAKQLDRTTRMRFEMFLMLVVLMGMVATASAQAVPAEAGDLGPTVSKTTPSRSRSIAP